MTPEQEIKLEFAQAWLRQPDNAYAAALTLVEDRFQAFRMAEILAKDPEVKEIKKQLIDEYGEEHFLPTKSDMVRQIFQRAQFATEDGFVKMFTLIANMRGFIEKQAPVTINNTQTNNRIMVVPMANLNDNGSVDANHWEKLAISQQTALTQQG